MAVLGQKATKKHVKHIFEEIDVDHNGTIDFHEFIDVMQVQWKGMDLGKAVKIMKKHEEEENRQNDAQLDLRPVKTLYANMCGIKLHLRYFGTGMNCLLLVSIAIPQAYVLVVQPDSFGLYCKCSWSTASLHWPHFISFFGETYSTSCWCSRSYVAV